MESIQHNHGQIMKGIANFLFLLIVVIILASCAVIGTAYGIRIAAVRHGITRATEFFGNEESERGFAQLARIDDWAAQHPALISHLRCAAIVGYVTIGNDDAAFALANRELQRDFTPPPPINISQALFQVLCEHLDPICLRELGGRDPDCNNGYRTLLHALEAIGDPARLERINHQIALVFGKRGLEVRRVPPAHNAASPDTETEHDFGNGRFAVAAGASIRCYNHEGKYCGDLVPGALVCLTDIRNSKDGAIAVCQREGNSETPLLVRTNDLIIHHGDLSQIPPGIRALLIEQGQTTSALRRARRQAALRNPYAASYKKATSEYKAFQTDVERLTTTRDQAEGGDRMRYADQLHLLKNKEPELCTAYEKAKRNYETWKTTHTDTLDKDPAVSNLQTRVGEIASQLAPYFDS